MSNVKSTINCEVCESLGIRITSGMSYDDFYRVIVDGMKNKIKKLHINKVNRIIGKFERKETLDDWEQEVLAALYARKSVSCHV